MTKNPKEAEVIALAKDGLSYSKISEATGVSRSYCHRIAKAAGTTRGGEKPRATEWSDYDRCRLIGMFRGKMSANMIAARLGVSHGSVVCELRRLGLTRRVGESVVSVNGTRRARRGAV